MQECKKRPTTRNYLKLKRLGKEIDRFCSSNREVAALVNVALVDLGVVNAEKFIFLTMKKL